MDNKMIHVYIDMYLLLLLLSRFSHVWLFVTPWTVAHQALLSMGLSRQEYWSRLPFPSSGDLPGPGIEPASLTSSALAGGFFTTGVSWEAPYMDLKQVTSLSRVLQPRGLQPTRLLHPWDFTGMSTGVGCHCLLQRIFLTQGLNSGLPHCKQMLYRLSHQEVHMHVSIPLQSLFSFRLLQSIHQCSLCYTVGSCWLSVFYMSEPLFVESPFKTQVETSSVCGGTTISFLWDCKGTFFFH